MSSPTHHLQIIRQNLLSAISELTLEELTRIPSGYNNHILWNACHMLVTQQLLVYGFSDLPLVVSQSFVENYRKGTRPDNTDNAKADFEYLNKHFLTSVKQLESDIVGNVFHSYREYSTSFGVTLKSAKDAIVFNNIHESMHLGYVMAIKHSL